MAFSINKIRFPVGKQCAHSIPHNMASGRFSKFSGYGVTYHYNNGTFPKSDGMLHKKIFDFLPIEPEKKTIPASRIHEISQQCTAMAVKTICDIARDNMYRLDNFEKDPQLLEEGVFYPNEYYEALKKVSNHHFLNTLKIQGHFYHGYAPPELFEMVKNAHSPTGYDGFIFVLKKGVSPTDALNGLQKGVSLLDCVTSCQLAYWNAIKTALKERFNVLFSADSPTPLRIDPVNWLESPLYKLVTVSDDFSGKAKKGQMIGFRNVSAYGEKHPIFGIGANYYTICCDGNEQEPTFTTLGLNPEGERQSDICKRLFDEFNEIPEGILMRINKQSGKVEFAFPYVGSLMAQLIANCLSEKEVRDIVLLRTTQYSCLQDFKKEGGGKIRLPVFGLNMKRIAQLIEAKTDEEARCLLDSWSPEYIPHS